MRRTLAVLVTAGAFLVPAGAASAADAHTNASCSNGKGGNYDRQLSHTYNGLGNVDRATSCTTSSTESRTTGWEKNHGGSEDTSGDEELINYF